MKVLITGVAGFIGMHTAIRLASEGHVVGGIDNLNEYYDVNLKKARLSHIEKNHKLQFYEVNLVDKSEVNAIFHNFAPQIVINLAAQAGVRHSISNPKDYIDSNLVGFANILESCRLYEVEHLIYASSSSVYGMSSEEELRENQRTDNPISLYGATKKSNELMAFSYSHLFSLPVTGLRFFTVYGPWGRPDMAYFKFTQSILSDKPLDIYNFGNLERDFTYIDDVMECMARVIQKHPLKKEDVSSSADGSNSASAPSMTLNIGNSKPVNLMDFISEIERYLGKKAIYNYVGMQKGDVLATRADCSKLNDWIGYMPNTKIDVGIKNFIQWYLQFYKVIT